MDLTSLLNALDPLAQAAILAAFPHLGEQRPQEDPGRQASKLLHQEAANMRRLQGKEAANEQRILKLKADLASAVEEGQEIRNELREAKEKYQAAKEQLTTMVEAKEQRARDCGQDPGHEEIFPDEAGMDQEGEDFNAEGEVVPPGLGGDGGGLDEEAQGAAVRLLEAIPSGKRAWLKSLIEMAAAPDAAGKRRKVAPPLPLDLGAGGPTQEAVLHAILRSQAFRSSSTGNRW